VKYPGFFHFDTSRRVNGSFKEAFLYLDSIKPVAQLAEDGTVSSVFVYGTRFNSPDLIIKDGVTYRVVHYHVGSPIYVINAQTGDVVQKMTFDSWGNVLSDSNPGFQPFGFAGGIYDPLTGLVRFGARDYDSSIGRWLNRDPIRFDGGWNLYAYVGNDPINNIDPFGTISTRRLQVSR
jgi:RHS repeat-associated protein